MIESRQNDVRDLLNSCQKHDYDYDCTFNCPCNLQNIYWRQLQKKFRTSYRHTKDLYATFGRLKVYKMFHVKDLATFLQIFVGDMLQAHQKHDYNLLDTLYRETKNMLEI